MTKDPLCDDDDDDDDKHSYSGKTFLLDLIKKYFSHNFTFDNNNETNSIKTFILEFFKSRISFHQSFRFKF